MTPPKLSPPRSRSDLIAAYTYGRHADGFAISQADRDKAASSGAAMPDGSYPILACEGENSVDTAVSAVGRGSGSHNAIRKHIMTRARSLGCSSKIPENWNDDGSLQTTATGATRYGVAPPVDAPPKPADAPTDPAGADSAVSDAIAAVKEAVAKAVQAQKADPDAKDPKDQKVAAGLDALTQAVDELVADQDADAAASPAPDAKPAPATAPKAAQPPAPKPAPPLIAAVPPIAPKPSAKPSGAATAPTVNPTDPATGDIDPKTVCANPDCGHLASSHLNDDVNGQNTGACQMTNCECLGMQVDSEPNTGTGDDGGQNVGGAEPSPGSEELAAMPGAVPDAPMPPGPAHVSTEPTLNAPPAMPGGENVGPAFTIPVGVIEGQPTGDGRQIAPRALTWRTPPLPLMGLATDTHDPEGMDLNDPAVICGRIDTIERQPGQGDTEIIVVHGNFLANDDGAYFAGLVEQMGRIGVSADIAVTASEIEVGQIDDDGWPSDMSEILTEGTIMAFTVCPMAAFEGAYIVLGDGTEPAAAIPQATEPVTAAGIHWMTYAQCEQCQQGLDVITAAGGPVAPPPEWFENPNFQVGDGRLAEILDRRGQRTLAGKYACPLTVTDDGRVWGHLAPWDVCHIGKPGCVTAPHSATDYAYFKRGQHVVCADGSKVRVGILTVDAPHAGLDANASSAMAHYDNVATAAADVAAGEDEFGIWIAGRVRPTATPEQVAALRASSISGDWRGLGGSLELVAALAVPVPGFPHAVVAGAQEETLLASGASVMHRLKHPAAPAPVDDAALLRMARPGLLKLARDSARERIAALRG